MASDPKGYSLSLSDFRGLAVVIMGVSGSGKSTVGETLGKALNCSFLDADDFHPQSNKEKMSKGIPLSEDDRIPWLQTLRDTLKKNILSGNTVVLACSALQKRYREILRTADPRSSAAAVKFVFLDAPAEVISARLNIRAKEGKHFMPASLLQSQLDLLQIDVAEGITTVDATLSPRVIVNTIQSVIF